MFVLFLPYVKRLFKKNKQNKPEDKQQEEYSFPVEIAFDYHLSNTITVAMAKWHGLHVIYTAYISEKAVGKVESGNQEQ